MYNENDHMNMTTRDRINEELLTRGGNQSPQQSFDSRINCKGEIQEARPMQTKTWGLENYPLASVYSPIQHWRNLYEPEEALNQGTLFKELDLPFMCGDKTIGGGCCGN